MARLVTIGLGALLLSGSYSTLAADPQRGASIFQARCAMCHSEARNGPPNFGPNLFGVVDRAPGSQPGFDYSTAMRANRIRWSLDRLGAYIEAPARIVPGVRMSDPDIRDPDMRADLIAYLATLK